MGDLTPRHRTELFARFKAGQHAVKGPTGYQCTDLIEAALKKAGAKSLSDFEQPETTRNFIWGKPIIDFKDIQPGDILQFSYYSYNVLSFSGKPYEARRGPQHTALVTSVIRQGVSVQVIEQHIEPDISKIFSNVIYLKNSQILENGAYVTVVVDGKISAYRPQAK